MRMCSGAMAGVFATLFTYPIDVARAKLTVQERTTKSYNGRPVSAQFIGRHFNSKKYGVKVFSLSVTIKMKALKCKPSAHYACTVSLIDGLGASYAVTRGLHASSSRRV